MKITVGSILDEVTEGVILQQVNCQGVMGSGFAKAIRDKWPVVYTNFKSLSDRFLAEDRTGRTLLGECQLVKVGENLFVANLFAQQYFGKTGARFTSYEALESSLKSLWREVEGMPIHHPEIGCGLGGGSWPIVRKIIAESVGETTLWVHPTIKNGGSGNVLSNPI